MSAERGRVEGEKRESGRRRERERREEKSEGERIIINSNRQIRRLGLGGATEERCTAWADRFAFLLLFLVVSCVECTECDAVLHENGWLRRVQVVDSDGPDGEAGMILHVPNYLYPPT